MSAPRKSGYFILEGLNSLASAFFFNHFLFHLRDHYGFNQAKTLWLLSAFGLVYATSSVLAGRFAQKHGYFTSLTIGLGGLCAGILLAWVWPSLVGQLVALTLWTVTICYTWPVLEALCSEFESPARLKHQIGIYNVTWAIGGALGIATGGFAVERLGSASLFTIPLALHALQLLMLPSLRRQREAQLTRHPHASATGESVPAGPPHFRTMGWIANPLAYMAAHAFTASLPTVSVRLQLSQADAGLWLGLWNWVRALGFIVLWQWTGWHYRIGLFMAGFAGVVVGFLGCMIAPDLAWSILAQIAFGVGLALVYSSSLFYAMDGSQTHGEQGGIHESLIGIGMGSGPALTALALDWSGSPAVSAWTVSLLLATGWGSVGWIHSRVGKVQRLRSHV